MESSVVVNGTERPLGEVGGHVTLLDWLRADGWTGSKEGCAEGECGACAVLVLRPDGPGSRWVSINACLAPAAALDGQEIVTAEGLGAPEELHPVQQEMAHRGGSQCGYCTPGFVCAMAAEYYRAERTPTVTGNAERAATADPQLADALGNGHGGDGHSTVRTGPAPVVQADPTAPGHAADHEHGPNGFDLHALSGNLCRCTGYRPIRDAAYALGRPTEADPLQARTRQPAPPVRRTWVDSPSGEFVRPDSFDEALRLLAQRPDAQLLAGSTDWGVELNLRHDRAALTVAIDHLPELRGLTETAEGFEVGAALTLTEAERGLAGRVPLLAELFPQFASRLIRNAATLGGNLGTASPIGDSIPVLLALDVSLVLASVSGQRSVALADYFTGYRRTARRPDELIANLRIPKPLAAATAFHKIAKRRFDDISSVSIAYALDVDGGAVKRASIGLGGVAATPIRARATEQLLTGRPWRADVVAEAADALGQEGTPLDDHRASARYRAAMLAQSLRKFYADHPGDDEESTR